MSAGTDEGFAVRFKALVDRICGAEGLSRSELVEDLSVSLHAISTAAYRGEIGFDLVVQVAKRAACTWEEIDALDLAWLRIRAVRSRDDALGRVLRRIDETERHIANIVAYAEGAGFGPQFRRFLARKREETLATWR